MSVETDDLEEDFVALAPAGEDDDDEDQYGDNDDGVIRGAAEPLTAAAAAALDYDKYRDLPPWMESYVDYRRVNHLVALHNEIVAFCQLMEPRQDEMKQRQDLVDRFTTLAEATFAREGCQVDVFGSQATGLCLPTSDIDIAIQINGDESKKDDEAIGDNESNKNTDMKTSGNNKNKKGEQVETTSTSKMISRQQELDDMKNWDIPSASPLQRLARALREQWLDDLSYLEVIENTRVPLVKFTHSPTNISIDVCFNQKSGPYAATLMHQYMEALPPLRPLTFVLKSFLASRGLNKPYTGGVGSFLLQMMIVSFLQHRERDAFNNRRPSLYNLGALLVEFFEFYSTDFNFILTGISVRFDGFFFPKGAKDRKKDYWQPQRPFSISFENPLDPSHDIGSPSFRISVVQRSFEVAFKTLLCHVSEPFIPTVSILASILPPSAYDEMWERSKNPQRTQQLQATNHLRDGQGMSAHEPPRKRQRR